MLKEFMLKNKITGFLKRLNRNEFKNSDDEINIGMHEIEWLKLKCNEYIDKAANDIQLYCNLCTKVYINEKYINRLKRHFVNMGINYYSYILKILGICDINLNIIYTRLNQYKYIL